MPKITCNLVRFSTEKLDELPISAKLEIIELNPLLKKLDGYSFFKETFKVTLFENFKENWSKQPQNVKEKINVVDERLIKDNSHGICGQKL